MPGSVRQGILVAALCACASMATFGCRGNKEDKPPAEQVAARPAPATLLEKHASVLPTGTLMIGFFDAGAVYQPLVDDVFDPGDFPEQRDNLAMMRGKISRILEKGVHVDISQADYMMYAVYGGGPQEVAFIFGGVMLGKLDENPSFEVNGRTIYQVSGFEEDGMPPTYASALPDGSGVIAFTSEAVARLGSSLADDKENRAVQLTRELGTSPNTNVFMAFDIANPHFGVMRHAVEAELGKLPRAVAVSSTMNETSVLVGSAEGDAKELQGRILGALDKVQAEILEDIGAGGDPTAPVTSELGEVYARYFFLTYRPYLDSPKIEGDLIRYRLPSVKEPGLLLWVGLGGFTIPQEAMNWKQWEVHDEHDSVARDLGLLTVFELNEAAGEGVAPCKLPEPTSPSSKRVPKGGERVPIELDETWDDYKVTWLKELDARGGSLFVYEVDVVDGNTMVVSATADFIPGGEVTRIEYRFMFNEGCRFDESGGMPPERWQ